VTLALSVAPNGYVTAMSRASDELLIHQLVAGRLARQGDRRWPA
jgi:hypothetical protein